MNKRYRLLPVLWVTLFSCALSQASCTQDNKVDFDMAGSNRSVEVTDQGIADMNMEQATSEDQRGIFVASAHLETADISDDPTIIRARFVDINFELLEGAEEGDSLILNLFDDVVLIAKLDRLEAAGSDGYTWTGHVDGIDHSQVLLVIGGGQMAGNITLPDEFYQVRFAGNGVHAIYRIDQSAFPPEEEPILPGD
jgi:hypothetical protein